MTQTATDRSPASVAAIAQRARAASRILARVSPEVRNQALLAAAQAIEDGAQRILDANAVDCKAAEPAVASGEMSSAMFARLHVNAKGIAHIATQIREVAQLPDPLGRRLSGMELDEGLTLYRESCPFGVIGVIFESRPDVVPQVASLTLKTANAIILKGGSEAAHTNEAIVAIWRESLEGFPAIPADSIHLLHTRAEVLAVRC